MNKRIVAILLVVFIMTSFIVGCSNNEDETNNKNKSNVEENNSNEKSDNEQDKNDNKNGNKNDATNNENSSDEGDYTLPLTDEVKTIVYAGRESWTPQISLADNRDIWQAMEKDTNVKVEWQVYPAGDYKEAMNVRIAAMELPDIMYTEENPIELYRSGISIKTTDLIEKFAPNIRKRMAEEDPIRLAMVAPDGETYRATCIVNEQKINIKDIYYRTDWAKALGFGEPKTIDDYYNLLVAFANDDPNGNGENDEVAYSLKHLEALGSFGTAFDLTLQWNKGLQIKDGKVTYDYIRDEFKDYLVWLNKLYDEGVFVKELLIDNTTEKSLISSNKVGFYNNGLGQCNAYDALIEGSGVDLADGGYNWAPAAINPNTNEAFVEIRPRANAKGIVITTSCEDPELAIKWLDYVWASDEGIIYNTYGIEGKTYEVVDDKIVFTDYILNNPDGNGVHAALRTVGGFSPDLAYWTDAAFEAQWIENEKLYAIPKKAAPYFTREAFPEMIGTADSEKRIAQIKTDLDTYREEMMFKFITGEMPIDEFDTYVEQMKKLNVEEYISLLQETYDNAMN